jgi:hypothetical protein
MSALDRRRIRVDWEELEDAFADSSADHRYYLDRETGAVHFFSSYLDDEDEAADEKAIEAESRYVLIPYERRLVPSDELSEFVRSIEREPERRALESSLRSPEAYRRFEETLSELPSARNEWELFVRARLSARIKTWLADVAVDPLE